MRLYLRLLGAQVGTRRHDLGHRRRRARPHLDRRRRRSAARPSSPMREVDRQRTRHRPDRRSATTPISAPPASSAMTVVIGEGAEIGDLTADGAGTPRRRLGDLGRLARPQDRHGRPRRAAGPPAVAGSVRAACMTAVYASCCWSLPPLGLLPIFPAFCIFDRIDDQLRTGPISNYLWYLPILAWPTAMVLIVVTVLLIAGVPLGRPAARDARASIRSIPGFYVRKWIVALATEVTLETLSSLFATVYMRGWYRLMGAKIGKGAEISTNLVGPLRSRRDRRAMLHRRRGRARRRGDPPRLDDLDTRQDRRRASSSAMTRWCRRAP